jgi:hypothetical protein
MAATGVDSLLQKTTKEAIAGYQYWDQRTGLYCILAENVYNMDKTGVMLSIPGLVKVLVGKVIGEIIEARV